MQGMAINLKQTDFSDNKWSQWKKSHCWHNWSQWKSPIYGFSNGG